MYFAHHIDFFFFALLILKKMRINQVRFLLVWVLEFFIRAILEQSINNKMVSKV